MLRAFITILLFVSSQAAYSQDNMGFFYAGLKFKIPSNILQIATYNDHEGSDSIAFQYQKNGTEKYIAFNEITGDKLIDYGCPVRVFYDSVFSGKNIAECNNKVVAILRDVYVQGKEVKQWSTSNYSINYSKGDDETFVYISNDEGKLVRIGSDLLSYQEVKKMLASLGAPSIP